MNIIYKAYCITNALFTKTLNYVMEKKSPLEYNDTQRMNNNRQTIVHTLYHFTYPMTRITPRIYLGNAYNSRDYYALKHANVGLIINCTTEFPNYFPDEFDYVQVPVQDIPNESLVPYFQTITGKMHTFLRDNPEKSIFIHCFMGASRSVSFLIAYFVRYHNMTVDETIEKISALRPFINLNVDFYFQLVEYHMSLNTELVFDDDSHDDTSAVRDDNPRA